MLALQRINYVVSETEHSLFKKTERILERLDLDSELFSIQGGLDKNQFRSTVDYLFCCMFPKWAVPCFQFYEDTGKPLRDHKNCTTELIRSVDTVLVAVVKVLKIHRDSADQISWPMLRELFIK